MDETEIYVRDHLLIQWMLWEFGIILKPSPGNDLENVYNEWIKWVKKMEENNEQRGKV